MNLHLLATVLAFTMGITGPGDSEEAAAPMAQSPAALLARSEGLNLGREVVARFRVGSVDNMPVTGPEEESYVFTRLHPASDADLAARKQFYVEIGPDAAAALKRVGITGLRKHFIGKTIEVRGTWQVAIMQLKTTKPMRFYHVRVDDLDQFLAVEDEPHEREQ